LEEELEAVGIRINTQPPNITFKVKKAGGISYTCTVKTNHLSEKIVVQILHDYRVLLL
jgi:ribosome-interacting GTPase 1